VILDGTLTVFALLRGSIDAIGEPREPFERQWLVAPVAEPVE
jgi:hypothetical protein